MLQNIIKKLKSLKASYALTVLFLLFIFYVGLAAFPQFLINTGDSFQWDFSLRDYIRSIDDQYHGMLETKAELPILHDKGTYINLNGMMADLLGQPMMNERVKLSNGHLTSVVETPHSPEEVKAAADNITRLYQKQAEQGKHFLFIMVSSQVSKYDDLLPKGYTDITNDTADKLLALLEESGVPCLDLRESMREDGLTVTDSYFVTDHHWLPQTGFWAYTKILEKLDQMGAISTLNTYYTDVDNFEFLTYTDSFLGSSGKRTGIYFAGLDDSCLIIPKFDTNISVTIESQNIAVSGRYEDTAYSDTTKDFSNLDFFNSNYYSWFGWGDQDLTQWRNEQAPENTKIMLIGDSFGNVPFSLMSLYATSCDELDMRYYTGDFVTHYINYDPDTVILEVNVSLAISENTMASFFPK